MRKMNAELKTRWLAALRSDDYTQTQGCLRDPHGSMCCLGVLCDVSGLGKWTDAGYYTDPKTSSADDDVELPLFMVVVVGVDPQAEGRLVEMNDVDEKTFPEIADWVEENL